MFAVDVPEGVDVMVGLLDGLHERGLTPANVIRGTIAVRDLATAQAVTAFLRHGWPAAGCNIDVVVQPPVDVGVNAAVQAWVSDTADIALAEDGLAFRFPRAQLWVGAINAPHGSKEAVIRAMDALDERLAARGMDVTCLAKTWSYLPERPGGAAAAFRVFNDARFIWFARRGLDDPHRWPSGGFPANTGVGADAEDLRLSYVAASSATALQNPLQQPPHAYDRSFASSPALFSRAVHVPLTERDGVVLVAGTASVHGGHVTGSGAGEQAAKIAGLLDALLNAQNLRAHGVPAAEGGIQNVEALTVFVAHPADAPDVRHALVSCGVPHDVPLCLLTSRMSREAMVVEVEGWATVEFTHE